MKRTGGRVCGADCCAPNVRRAEPVRCQSKSPQKFRVGPLAEKHMRSAYAFRVHTRLRQPFPFLRRLRSRVYCVRAECGVSEARNSAPARVWLDVRRLAAAPLAPLTPRSFSPCSAQTFAMPVKTEVCSFLETKCVVAARARAARPRPYQPLRVFARRRRAATPARHRAKP